MHQASNDECHRYQHRMTSQLTLFEKTLHLLTCLIVVDEDIEAQTLEAFEQLTSVSICAIAYIHPCPDNLLRVLAFYATKMS